MLRWLAFFLLIQMLAACSAVFLSPDMEKVKDEPLAYQEGYQAGCNSGYLAGGSIVHSFKRDTERILVDPIYNDGWKFGYRQCKLDFREMCKSKALISKGDMYCSDVKQQGLDKEE